MRRLALLFLLSLLATPEARADDLAGLSREYREACRKVGGTPESRARKAKENVVPVLRKIGALDTEASLAFLIGELEKAPVLEIAEACVGPVLASSDPRAVSFLLGGFSRRPPPVQAAILAGLATAKHRLSPHEGELVAIALSRLAPGVKRRVPGALARLDTVPAARALLSQVGGGKKGSEDEAAFTAGVLQAFQGTRNPSVKEWLAGEAFSVAAGSPAALEVLLRAVAHLKLAGARRGVEEQLLRPSLRIAAAALRALNAMGVEGSLPAVAKALEGRKGREAQGFVVECLDTLARTGDDQALEVVIRFARGADPLARNLAMGSLGFARSARAVPALLGGLLDQDPYVRRVALRSLRRFKEKSMVGALIGALERQEDEAFRAMVGDFLIELTGKPIAPVAEDWRKWWQAAEESFVFPAAGGEKPPTMVKLSYFGLGIDSRRLALLVDISSSMRQVVPVRSAGGSGRARKIEVLKQELERLLEKLPEDTSLNIISFDGEIHPWRKALEPLKGSGRGRAIRYARSLKTATGTNVYDTLELALRDESVDTVYLLTDGEPSRGKFTRPEDILREVAKLNRTRAVTIHAIAFGEESAFLKQLAAANSGRYRFVDSY